jgi:molybdopterin synthase catalytic subunit/molybdopterin converting factor small subunit
MKVRVRLWGGLAEAAGFTEDVLELDPGALAGDVLDVLTARAPRLERYRSATRVAVNADVVDLGTPLADGDEVALLPPVAGGQDDVVEIRPGALDPSEAIGIVTTPASGGIGVFVGVVRETNEGMAVAEIDYTAYEEMALKAIGAVVDEARARWPLHRLAVVHSVGRLRVGDASVVVAVSAEHRAEALDACRYVIDGLKERAPIWKQEFGPDGTRWVNLPAEDPTAPPAR